MTGSRYCVTLIQVLSINRIKHTWTNRRTLTPKQWRQNERDDVSNHQCLDHLLNRLFRRRSKKTSKLRLTGDPWIPLTKGQWRGKCFYLMTSSHIDLVYHVKTSRHGNALSITVLSRSIHWSPNDQQCRVLRVSLVLARTPVEQTFELPMIRDAMVLMWRHCTAKMLCIGYR